MTIQEKNKSYMAFPTTGDSPGTVATDDSGAIYKKARNSQTPPAKSNDRIDHDLVNRLMESRARHMQRDEDKGSIVRGESPVISDNQSRIYKTPIPAAPVSDSTGTVLDLPSQFFYYDFKDIRVHPLRALHLAKLSRSSNKESLRMMCEVFSTILTTSNPSYADVPLAFHLTIPDFYWILYYVRLNDYSKTSYRHRTVCRDPDHVGKVERGELKPESLRIEQVIERTDMKDTVLEQPFSMTPVLESMQERYDIRFQPATMLDVIEITDLLDQLMNEESPEVADVSFLSVLASCFVFNTDDSIQRRVQLASTFSIPEVEEVKALTDIIEDYGVEEYIKTTCKECGASRTTKVEIDASSFLPS